MSKPILGYWKIRGLGQPIRFLLAYLGTDYEEKRYETMEAWFGGDKFNLGLDFPNVPYWIEGDVRMTEFRAILRHISRERGQAKNLLPSDSVSQRKLDMLENALTDIWYMLIRTCVAWTDELKEMFEKNCPQKLEQISKYLENKKFLLGDQPTYVDFILYEIIYGFQTFDVKLLQQYPALDTFKKTFEAIPEIAAYIQSPKYIPGPCIAPFAKRPI
jgi:glutathione S-transferase